MVVDSKLQRQELQLGHLHVHLGSVQHKVSELKRVVGVFLSLFNTNGSARRVWKQQVAAAVGVTASNGGRRRGESAYRNL